jgi:Xaa-Pro aminopeptidase
MRRGLWILVTVLITSVCVLADNAAMRDRRQRAATTFHDGILLLHSKSQLDITSDGFRQDPYFYYFTGLQNTVGALFAIDGKSGESWLFLPSNPPYVKRGLQPEVAAGPEAVKQLGIEHVVDWSDLEGFLVRQAGHAARLYYVEDPAAYSELPPNLVSQKAPEAPSWLQEILQKWPAFEVNEASERINALMAIQSADAIMALRSAAKATVTALMAGLGAIRPNLSQRSVEAVVEGCPVFDH